LDAIRPRAHGAIAVTVEWVGETERKMVIDWAVIYDEAEVKSGLGSDSAF
jgi:hypothetical protein